MDAVTNDVRPRTEPDKWRGTSTIRPTQTALVLSDVRFLCDCITDIILQLPDVVSCDRADTIETALDSIAANEPAIMLIDVALPRGKEIATHIYRTHTAIHVIALGVRETDDDVLAWVEAGIAGYVPNTSSVKDMLALIEQILRGEQPCTARIAGTLLRRISETSRRPRPPAGPAEMLTKREQEVRNLVNEGLSNKDIARRLRISLSTAKTHVHHVLGKMKATRRATVIAASGVSVRRQPDTHLL